MKTQTDMKAYRGGYSKELRKRGTYIWNDEKFKAVSTILGVIDKPALPRWASKSVAGRVKNLMERHEWTRQMLEKAATGEEKLVIRKYGLTGTQLMAALQDYDDLAGAPWKYRDAKADLGTRVHDVAEAFALDLPMPSDFQSDNEARMAETLSEWLKAQQDMEFLMAEATVVNRSGGGAMMFGGGYAGTLDWVARWGDDTWAIDIKTGSGVYPEHGLQLAAYAEAEGVLIPKVANIEGTFAAYAQQIKTSPAGIELAMPRIDRIGVLHVQATSCQLYEFDPESCGRGFAAAAQLYFALQSIDEPKLGPGWDLITEAI